MHEPDQESANHEIAGQSTLADIGELTGPLTHEFNNFLNSLLLQVAVLENQLPKEFRSELVDIRAQGRRLAELVRQIQQYRRDRRPRLQPVNLNNIVREVVATFGCASDCGPRISITAPNADGTSIVLDLAADVPDVMGTRDDLHRLCRFLLTNAVAALRAGGSVVIRTEGRSDRVTLSFADTGTALSDHALDRFFDPDTGGRNAATSLQLAASKSLVQRLQGCIRAANRPEGGIVLTVELTAAPTHCS